MRTLSSIALIILGIVLLAASINGSIFTLLDLPAILIYFIFIAAVLISTSNFKTFIMGINGAISKKYQMSKEQCDKTISLFQLLRKTVFNTSILILVVSIMFILGNLSDVSHLGPAIAVALIAIAYGAFINLFMIDPAIYILGHKHEDEPAKIARIKDKEALDKLLQLCFEKGLTHEDIMNADEIMLHKK